MDDPEELKAHLVFNEAQYAVGVHPFPHTQALGQYDEDIINDKEREIVGLRKSRAKGDEIGALISRNSELEVGAGEWVHRSTSWRRSVASTR